MLKPSFHALMMRSGLLWCLLAGTMAAQPKQLWLTTTTSSDSLNYGHHDAVRDRSGNVYVIIATPVPSGWGLQLIKYSNTGSRIRTTTLPILGGYGYKMTADPDGNVYIVVNDDAEHQTLIKYSASGDSLWAKPLSLPIPSGDYRSKNRLIASDADGNIIIAAQHEERTSSSVFRTYLMVTSYSPGGALRWMDRSVVALPSDREPEYGDLIVNKLVIDRFDRIHVGCTFRSDMNPMVYTADAVVVTYAPSGGTPTRIRTFSRKPVSTEFVDMAADESGTLFIGHSGGVIGAYSSDGPLLWQRTIAAGSMNMVLAADNSGGVYVALLRSVSFTKTNSFIYRLSKNDSLALGPFGSANFSWVLNMAVDPAGYLAASGFMKLSLNSAEGAYLFTEYAPTGLATGSVEYSSPGVGYEYPYYLFPGNGTYTVLGSSNFPLYKSLLWLTKFSVVPNPPPPPPGEPTKGWTAQTSGTTADLRSVWFQRGSEGWVTGDSGTILHTMDAGNTWTKTASPVNALLKEVKFFNDTLGIIVGTGCILRTVNGGTTWAIVSSFGDQTLNAVASNGSGTFVAVGTSGLGKVSKDWGATWTTIPALTAGTLYDVEYFHNAFIAAGDLAEVLATQTFTGWSTIHSPSLFGQTIRSVNVVDGKLRLYGGNLSMLDESMTYTQSTEFPPAIINAVSEQPNASVVVTVGNFGTVGTGGPEGSYVYRNVAPVDLYDVFQSGSFAVMVGANGTIMNYYGRTRVAEPSGSGIVLVDPLTHLSVRQQRLYRSTDGGNRWQCVDSAKAWRGDGFAVSGGSVWGVVTTDSVYHLLHSLNGGATWSDRSPVIPITGMPEVYTPNGTTAIVTIARNGTTARPVLFTGDAGLHWNVVDTVPAEKVAGYRFTDTTAIYRYHTDVYSNVYRLQKRTLLSPQWQTIFMDSSKGGLPDNRLFVLPGGELILDQRFRHIVRHSVDGGVQWKSYPQSITSDAYLEGRTFINETGTDLSLSADANFSSRVTEGHFFTMLRSGSGQSQRGASRLLQWNEEGQLVFQEALPVDTTQRYHRAAYRSSARLTPIPYNTAVADTIDMTAAGGNAVTETVVLIDSLRHTAVGDLTVVLSHLGVTDTLLYRSGEGSNNLIQVVFTDQATNDLRYVRAPFSFGAYKPHSPLEKFNGLDPNGPWVLSVHDAAQPDSGTLNGWSLKLVTDVVTAVTADGPVPEDFGLSQNYPNPFNPSTRIQYRLPVTGPVQLKVYDILGREAATLVNDVVRAGRHTAVFDAARFASGVYFARLTSGSHHHVIKMTLMK